MRFIHLVDSAAPLNFGIWNAAINTAAALRDQFGVESELWHPDGPSLENSRDFQSRKLEGFSEQHLQKMIHVAGLAPRRDLIVTHGSWQYPTRWGRMFSNLGYGWVYTPHGMLEPWSRAQKWLKKSLYLLLVERPFAAQADLIRAVSRPELENLKKLFPGRRIEWIPNGAQVPPSSEIFEKKAVPRSVLFLGRLHFKKNPAALAAAWAASRCKNHPNWQLTFAGPDQGELPKIQSLILKNGITNVHFAGMVSGEEKKRLLRESHYFVLPSESEGFPTAAVEAMSFGLVPILSEGCNFPEALKEGRGIRTGISEEALRDVLGQVFEMTAEDLAAMQARAYTYAASRYSLEKMAELQYRICASLLERR